ncbi:hypothetical protein BU15DRAFT_77872 [Melanogaster broomeanus]|nr:hypothetical protein BU15DRAFT_77872 [Melanogaster broomeanus]
MSSPITINYSPSPARMYEPASSPSSPGLYIPVHRRSHSSGVPSSYAYSSSSRASSPPPSPSLSHTTSSRSASPLPHHTAQIGMVPIYTPADLILLSASPLAKLSLEHRDALRAAAPELLQSRKQRKAREWRARHHPGGSAPHSHSHARTSSHVSHSSHTTSESDEDRGAWRRI